MNPPSARSTKLASLLLAGIILAPESQAAVNFTFNYNDAPGVGFNAAGSVGADRRAGLEQAAGYVSSFFVNYTADIVMDVDGSQTNDTTLASASSRFSAPYPGTGFGSQGDVMLKILNGNGADPSAGLSDGMIDWNFEDFTWEPLSDFQAGELDLISTAIHELTHAVGFASDISQTGTDGFGTPSGDASAWSPFDQYVADSSGSLINGGFVLDTARWDIASVGGTGANGLFFNGANAKAANGGNAVNLFSPTTWLAGSSGSHLDTNFFTGSPGPTENMMNHEATTAEGLDIRNYTAIEIGILRDLGYTQLVPEPSSALMILLSACALVVRRRSN